MFLFQSVLLGLVEFENVLGHILKNDKCLIFVFRFLELEKLDDVGMVHFFENLCFLVGNRDVIFHGFDSDDLLGFYVFGEIDCTEVAIAYFGCEEKLFLNFT